MRDWELSTNVDTSQGKGNNKNSKTQARASLNDTHIEDKESWARPKYEQPAVAIT